MKFEQMTPRQKLKTMAACHLIIDLNREFDEQFSDMVAKDGNKAGEKTHHETIKVKQERLANFAQRRRELEFNRDLNKQLKSIEL